MSMTSLNQMVTLQMFVGAMCVRSCSGKKLKLAVDGNQFEHRLWYYVSPVLTISSLNSILRLFSYSVFQSKKINIVVSREIGNFKLTFCFPVRLYNWLFSDISSISLDRFAKFHTSSTDVLGNVSLCSMYPIS